MSAKCTYMLSFRKEICDEANRQVFYMCPQCDNKCDFWYLTESCLSSKVSAPWKLVLLVMCICDMTFVHML